MHCTSVCLVLAMCLFSVTNAAEVVVRLLNSEDGSNCWKYCELGTRKFQVTHLRILWYDTSPQVYGKIIGNAICTFEKPAHPYRTKDCKVIGETTNDFAIMISVAAIESQMSSQVEYRYNSKTMDFMFEKRLLDNDALATQNFHHNTHIQVKYLEIKDVGPKHIRTTLKSCHHKNSYPGALIGDHGLYVHVWDNSNDWSWKRMYFDPTGLGEYLVFN